MKDFCDYVWSLGKGKRWPPDGKRSRQQNAGEFLYWIFSTFKIQLYDHKIFHSCDAFNEIIQVRKVHRRVCRVCGTRRLVRHRIRDVSLEDCLILDMDLIESAPQWV